MSHLSINETITKRKSAIKFLGVILGEDKSPY